ncbi:MAG: ATP-binding protein [Candidatus Micrarchaeia archaeon]
MAVRDALVEQKRELAARLSEKYVEREIAVKGAQSGLVNVFLGPRRAGKSFFAMHFLQSLGKPFGYANFDDERLAAADCDEVVAAISSVYSNPRTLLLDEVQNVPKWELFVNRLQRQDYKLFVTGSNSHLLSSELSTHLTGRHLPAVVLPFSFREYLRLSPGELTSGEKKAKLDEYVSKGGFAEPLLGRVDAKDYLSALFDSVIYKDVVRRFRIRSVPAMEDLCSYLLSNIACECSYNALGRISGNRSAHTAKKYAGYLEDAFLFFFLPRFSFKVKEQLSSNRKAYCIDNGFVFAKAFRFSENRGRMYENAVAIELKRMELGGAVSVYYWQDALKQNEVDFLVRQDAKVVALIQVCVDAESGKAKGREARGLLKAGKETGCRNLIVLTRDEEKTESVEWFGIRGRVRYLPLWKWMLESHERRF